MQKEACERSATWAPRGRHRVPPPPATLQMCAVTAEGAQSHDADLKLGPSRTREDPDVDEHEAW